MDALLRYNLLKDLKHIKYMLNNCSDEKLKYLLISDIKNINYNLGLLGTKIVRINNQSQNEIINTITSNKIEFLKLKPFPDFFQNKKVNYNEIFKKFIDSNKFNLKQIYYDILSHNRLYYNTHKSEILGRNIYINFYKKNYIEVYKNNKVKDYISTVHELGHSYLNLINDGSYNANYTSNFSEAFTNFIELKFMDYIGEYNLDKISFNLKYDFFMNLIVIIEYLNDNLSDYLYTTDTNFKELYDYNYKLFLSKLLALHFYNLYSLNQSMCMNKLNTFINKFGVLDDIEILKSININLGDLKNMKILYMFYENLIKQKNKIKQKI